MAGSLAIITKEHGAKAATAIGEQWEIQYSRFIKQFSGSSHSSTCEKLAPLSKPSKNRNKGLWLSSSSSSSALLQFLVDHSSSEVILVVSFQGKIHEEHFLEKLQFSWPQVSCIAGFPPRGSRVILVSYRDCADQVQKFALRFPTADQTQMFMYFMKEVLTDAKAVGLPKSEHESQISTQSEFVFSCRTPYREDLLAPTDTCTSDNLPSMGCKDDQCSLPEGTTSCPNVESIIASLPPSFTTLLTNCGSAEQAHPTSIPQEDLRSQVMKYMEDSSFHDMLIKVEKVIGEMGYDMHI